VNNRAELATALTAAGTTSGLTLTINGSNEIDVASTSEDAVTIGGTGSVLTALGLTAGSTNPTATITTASDARTDLQAQYNTLLTQITQLAGDASFNGINLLDGDALTVTFNEDGSSTLTITGVDFSATGLGLNAPTGDGFQVDANIDTAVDELSAALSELRTQAAAFGSNMSIVQARQEFTKNTINVLQIGADNLTLADTNEESANMLALQTRQQLSTVALSLASQADQAVLRLF
jgi:flagellin